MAWAAGVAKGRGAQGERRFHTEGVVVTVYEIELGPEFDQLITHLAQKVVAKLEAGDREVRLTISQESNQRYGGRIGIELSEALATAGMVCNCRQWSGPGHSAVLEINSQIEKPGNPPDT